VKRRWSKAGIYKDMSGFAHLVPESDQRSYPLHVFSIACDGTQRANRVTSQK